MYSKSLDVYQDLVLPSQYLFHLPFTPSLNAGIPNRVGSKSSKDFKTIVAFNVNCLSIR